MGFKLFINDDEDSVWESESENMDVDRVQVLTARGEVYSYGSSADDEWVRIVISERAQVETYLGQAEAAALKERQEKYEVKQDSSTEGYVAADPETGAPVESNNEMSTDSTETAPMDPANTSGRTTTESGTETEAEASLAEF